MKLIDISQPDLQLQALNAIDADAAGWQEADVTLEDLSSGNIVMLGRRLELALKEAEGVILTGGVDRLKVFFKAESATDLNASCGGLPCAIKLALATAEHIGECAARANNAARALQHKGPPKSALFEHRKKRDKNVMLVADDDQLICAAMKAALGKYGECVIVHKADEVLDAYLNHAPDSVFLDLHLEGGTGIEGIGAIMAYDRDAYIVMLTGDSTATHAVAAKKAGAKSFISKPIVLSRLEYELFQSPTFRRYA